MGEIRTENMYVTTDGRKYHDITQAQNYQAALNLEEDICEAAKVVNDDFSGNKAEMLKKLNREFELVYSNLGDMFEHIARMHTEIPEIRTWLNSIDSTLKARQTGG